MSLLMVVAGSTIILLSITIKLYWLSWLLSDSNANMHMYLAMYSIKLAFIINLLFSFIINVTVVFHQCNLL